MRYLPLFIDVRGKPCLLLGGGEVALRKARTLLGAGAKLRVVAPQVEPSLALLIRQAGADLQQRPYEPRDLQGMRVVVAATDDKQLNARIADEANAAGLLANAVDDPAHCNFIVPSIIDRSPVVVAVSSSGAAPVLARMLRARLETLIAPGYGRLAELLGRHRARVQTELPRDVRRAFWEAVLEGPVAEQVFAGDDIAAEALLVRQIEAGMAPAGGEVLLVHAGPGEPDLLTLRALRQLERASHVVHAPDVPEAVLALARRDAVLEAVAQGSQVAAAVERASVGARVCALRTAAGFTDAERAVLRDSGLAWLDVPGLVRGQAG